VVEVSFVLNSFVDHSSFNSIEPWIALDLCSVKALVFEIGRVSTITNRVAFACFVLPRREQYIYG
jgi:hypothetical protein